MPGVKAQMENTQPLKKPVIKTTIACAVMLLLCLPRHSGFILLFFLIFLIPLFIKRYIVCIKDPLQKKLRISQALIWLSGILVVILVHTEMHQETRQIANKIAKTIEIYKKENGFYPSSPEEAGITQVLLHKERIFYSLSSGEPFLVYPATYIPFETYNYDFKTKEWRHISG